MVKVNGENVEIAGQKLTDYLEHSEYNAKRIAIELNGEILPKAMYHDTIINDGDEIEIVKFVGGG